MISSVTRRYPHPSPQPQGGGGFPGQQYHQQHNSNQGGYPGQQYQQQQPRPPPPQQHQPGGGYGGPGANQYHPRKLPRLSRELNMKITSPDGPPPRPPSNVQNYGPQTQGPDHRNVQPFFKYSQCTGKRKALCIGINYFGQNGELRGCINDARNIQRFLCSESRITLLFKAILIWFRRALSLQDRGYCYAYRRCSKPAHEADKGKHCECQTTCRRIAVSYGTQLDSSHAMAS